MDLTNVTMENKQAWTDKISELEASISNGGGGTASVGFKQYVAYTTQTGTNAPLATLVKNELSSPVTFQRTGTGSYTITATGAFTPYQKVVPYFNVQSAVIVPNTPHILIYWNDVNSLGVETYDDTNVLEDGIFVGNLVITLYD